MKLFRNKEQEKKIIAKISEDMDVLCYVEYWLLIPFTIYITILAFIISHLCLDNMLYLLVQIFCIIWLIILIIDTTNTVNKLEKLKK